MKDDNMKILETMLLTWTDDQVNNAWSLIAEEGKRRKDNKSAQLKSELKPGDAVSFSGRKSGKCKGKIVRIKRKKAIVSVKKPSGRLVNWDVPISMLERV